MGKGGSVWQVMVVEREERVGGRGRVVRVGGWGLGGLEGGGEGGGEEGGDGDGDG